MKYLTFIWHVTVPAMVASAVRQGSTPDAALAPGDYIPMPVFAAEMPLLDAAVLVMETGWDLAVVMAGEPRMITARSVNRGLAGSSVLSAAPAPMPRPCDLMSLATAEVRS